MKSKVNLFRTLGGLILASFAMVGCDEEQQAENQDDGSGLSSAVSYDPNAKGFDQQAPVELTRDGILAALDGRLVAKAESFESDMKSMEEQEQSMLALLDHPMDAPQDPGNEDDSTLAEKMQKFRDFIAEEVLIEANEVSREADSVTYKLDPNVICEDDSAKFKNPDDIKRAQEDYADCKKYMAALAPKVKFGKPDEDTLGISVLFGNAAAGPVNMYFSSADVRATVEPKYVPEIVQTILANVTEPPQVEFPSAWAGMVEISLARAGDRIYVLTGKMLEEASIAAKVQGLLFGVKIGQAKKLVRVTVDANEKHVNVAVNTSIIDATAPLEEILKDNELLAGAQAYMKQVDVHLEPIGIDLSVHLGEKKLDFSRIEMSDKPYYINHDGKELASVVFPGAEAIAAKIEEASGGMDISLSSGVSIKVATKLAELSNIMADLGGDLLDEVVTIDISGAAPKFEGREEQFKVASGQVSITSKAANATLVVQEGQCLEFTDDMSEHWLLNGSAGACRF